MSQIEEFTIESDHGIWPRRLLHVPSMTSLERREGNIYGTAKEPLFNVLSYTWGRWEVPDGPALPVKGTTWKIPSIDPERFTVAQFEKIVQRITQGFSKTDFVWIDVACIDQVDRAVKMEEVGNQAGIFNQCSMSGGDVFVWLHETSSEALQKISIDLDSCSERLQGDEVSTFEIDGMEYTTNWRGMDDTRSEVSLTNEWFPPCLLDDTWIASVKTALDTLLSDKWFSSLWTLQEAHLSPLAFVLSQEGEVYQRPGFEQAGLAIILASSGKISSVITTHLDNDQFSDQATSGQLTNLNKIRELIDQLPILGHENPALLYTSAGLRKCRDPLDRIYAIMQVFNFRLGEAADASRRVTLPDLELELAVELDRMSPVWGQYFIHRGPSSPGRSWCITQSCWVPPIFRFIVMDPISECSISLDLSGNAIFKGRQCSLESMAKMWAATSVGAHERPSGFWGWKDAVQCVVLDQSEFVRAHFPAELLEAQGYSDPRSPNHQSIVDTLLSCTCESFKVFVLGKIGYDGESDASIEDLRPGESETSQLGSVGLIVRQVEREGVLKWERVGMSIWNQLHEDADASTFEETAAALF